MPESHWEFQVSRLFISVAFLVSSDPLWAASIDIPEPSAMALVGIGVLGVIVGRHGSRRKRD